MTRYIERETLRDLLVASADPYAPELVKVLEGSRSKELVVVDGPVPAADLLPTYEVRLERARAGAGPRTLGLSEFVAKLRHEDIAEMFAVSESGLTGIGLMSADGRVVAVTLILGSGE